MTSPCTDCGACCAGERVGVYRSELDDAGGRVPAALTEPHRSQPDQVVMRGTWAEPRCCVALRGVVGTTSHCRIYDERPEACRAFPAAWEREEPSPWCDDARARWGLPPVQLGWWR